MKNKKIILGITTLLTISLLATGCGKEIDIKNGSKVAVSMKGEKYTATEYYNKIKEKSISTLVEMMDHNLLDKKYKEDDDEKKYIDEQINQIKSYYGSNEESYNAVIKQYFGVESEKELENSLKLEHKRTTAVKDYINLNKETGAEVVGIHLEGPFLARRYAGAMVPEYIIKPNVEVFRRFEEASGGNIKLVTLAIEEEGADELIEYLKSKNITISIGHANATYQVIKDGIKKGVTSVTHTYNAMKPLRRDEIGTVGCTMLFDELYCEAICDGIHVSAPALKLLWENKPNDKFVLVTDSLRPKYLPNGIYPEADQIIVVQDGAARLDTGRLAGSILKMNQAVKNIMEFLEIDFETAVKCATENPAKNLGLFDEIGSIKEGKLANVLVVDKDVNVYQTIRRGKVVYKNK